MNINMENVMRVLIGLIEEQEEDIKISYTMERKKEAEKEETA